MKHLIFLDNSQ